MFEKENVGLKISAQVFTFSSVGNGPTIIWTLMDDITLDFLIRIIADQDQWINSQIAAMYNVKYEFMNVYYLYILRTFNVWRD